MKSKIRKIVAFAVFVKTPILSPLKTRLAKSIGKKSAQDFYHLSLQKIQSELKTLQEQETGFDIDCFWAIAEPSNSLHNIYWKTFPHIYQNQECLGARMSGVYNGLIHDGYDKVILIGSDSPQLTSLDYFNWCQIENNDQSVTIGPTKDGGFYCFVGGHKINKNIWTNVIYSQSDTTKNFVSELRAAGYSPNFLPEHFDVDEVDDLKELNEYYSSQQKNYLLAIEKKLLQFTQAVLKPSVTQ